MSSNRSEKLRAVFLAFVMVASVAVAGVAFSGGAAANPDGSIDTVEDGGGTGTPGDLLLQAGSADQNGESRTNGNSFSSITLKESSTSGFPGSGSAAVTISGSSDVTFNQSESLLGISSSNIQVSNIQFQSDRRITFSVDSGGGDAEVESITISGIAYDAAPTVSTSIASLDVNVGGEEASIPIDTVGLNSNLDTDPVNIVRGANSSGSGNIEIGAFSTLTGFGSTSGGTALVSTGSNVNAFAASGTNVTVSIDSRVADDLSFDQSASVGTVSSGTTTDLEDPGVEVNSNSLTFELPADLENGDEIELNNLAFNSTGVSDDAVDPEVISNPLNVSYTPASATGQITDQQTTRNVQTRGPSAQFFDDDGTTTASDETGTLSAGQNGQPVPDSNELQVVDDSGDVGGEIAEDTTVTVKIPSNSGVTFDQRQTIEAESSNNVAGGTGTLEFEGNTKRATDSDSAVSFDSNTISVDIVTASADGDRLMIGKDTGSGDQDVDPIDLNVSADSTAQNLNFTVTTNGGAEDIVQNTSDGDGEGSSFDLDVTKPAFSVNNDQAAGSVDSASGNDLTLGNDADGETQIDPSNNHELVFESSVDDDLIGGSSGSNITVTIPESSPFTFDKSQDDGNNLDILAGNDAAGLADGSGSSLSDADDGDISNDEVTIVDDRTLNITFDETGITAGDDLAVSGVQYNLSSGESGATKLQAVASVSPDVTFESDNFINVTLANADTIQSDADQGTTFGGTGSAAATVSVTVDSSQLSTIQLTNNTGFGDNSLSNFGGADVELAVTDSPDSGSADDISINTSTATTASDGTVVYNTTVADTAVTGTYNVTTSLASNASVNVTTQYNVQAGTASQFNVTGIDNAVIDQSGIGSSPTETEVAAYQVQIEDTGGNIVSGTDVDVSVQVDNGQLEQVNDQIAGDGSRGAGHTLVDGDNDGRTNYDASADGGTVGEFFVFASSGSPSDVNVTVSESGVSDSGTATVFDAVDSVAVEPESSSIAPGDSINVTATAQTSDSTTVEVPRLARNDLTSDNTTVLQRTSVSEEANGGTFANGTIEATFEAQSVNGTANITANIAGATGDATITVEEAGTASASVTFNNQSVTNGTEEVIVDSADFTRADGSAGDYVVVVHTIDEFGAPVGEVSAPIGASGDLTGNESDITVNLTAANGPINNITEDVTLRAMLHTTSDNSAFGSRLGMAIDGIEPGDETDDANITVTPESPLDGPAGDFDTDADGDIDIIELGAAGTAFAQGDLTIVELGEIGAEFAS